MFIFTLHIWLCLQATITAMLEMEGSGADSFSGLKCARVQSAAFMLMLPLCLLSFYTQISPLGLKFLTNVLCRILIICRFIGCNFCATVPTLNNCCVNPQWTSLSHAPFFSRPILQPTHDPPSSRAPAATKVRKTISSRVHEAVKAIALVHNVTPVYEANGVTDQAEAEQHYEDTCRVYQASSPDEVDEQQPRSPSCFPLPSCFLFLFFLNILTPLRMHTQAVFIKYLCSSVFMDM